MKNFAILSSELILLILALLGKPRQSICSRICLVLAIIDLKVIMRELLGPTDLSGAQALCIHESIEVIMIRKDENLMLAAFQIVTSSLEGFDNSQKLTVVGLVSYLCRNHFSKKERYWVPLAQIGLSDYPIRTSSGS